MKKLIKYLKNWNERKKSNTLTIKDRLNSLWIYPTLIISYVIVNLAFLTIIVPVGYYIITGRNYFNDFIDAPDGV